MRAGSPREHRGGFSRGWRRGWGVGRGVGGREIVLLERIGAACPGPLDFLEECMRERKTGVLATVIHPGK